MSKVSRRWVYHSTLPPKIITSDEFEKLSADGWADSPAKFAKIADFGVDENNPAAVQVLGEAMEGIKDQLNGALNIDDMTKKELGEYAKRHFDVDLILSRKIDKLRAEVKALIGE